MWLNRRTSAPDFPVLLGKGGNFDPRVYHGYEFLTEYAGVSDLHLVSGPTEIATANSNGKWIKNRTNEWVHVAVVLDSAGGAGRFYVDGKYTADERVLSGALTGIVYACTNDLFIGGPDPSHDANRAWFDGLLDEVRVYNRALGSNEVRALYEAGAPPPNKPGIVEQPTSQVVALGSPAVLSVTATGTLPLAYQWRKEGVEVAGRTNTAFALAVFSTNDAGNYDAIVTNAGGAVTSQTAVLSVYTNVAPTGLVLHFTFEEGAGSNVVDQSGNGNHGIVTGGAWTNGVRGGGVSFQGTASAGSIIRVPNRASLNSMASTRQLTVAMWLHVRSIALDFPVLLGKGGNYAPNVYNGYELVLDYWGVNDLHFESGPTEIVTRNANGKWINDRPDRWIHVAVVLDSTGGQGRFYVDGTNTADGAVTSGALTGIVYGCTNDLFIGGPDPSHHSSRAWFNGLLDEVRVYNRALGSNEVRALYEAGVPPPSPPAIVEQPAIQSVPLGITAVLSVTATGTLPLAYQWRKEGVAAAGRTNAAYSIGAFSTNDVGSYDAIVTNVVGAVTSQTAVLSVYTNLTPTGLVLHFTFEEGAGANVMDQSGNGNHGLLVQAGWTSGVAGAGASFRGTGGSGAVIKVLNSASLNSMQATRQLTACLWIRPRSFPFDIPVLVGKGGNQPPSATDGYEIYIQALAANELGFVSGTNYFSTPATGGSLIRSRIGQWVHVACTVDSLAGVGRFYVNGTNAGAVNYYGTSVTSLLYATTHDLYFGGPIPNHNANRSWFNGDMDEIRIYNRALTSNEVQALWAAHAPEASRPVFVTQPADAVLPRGASLTLSAAATGTLPLAYQWRRGGTTLPGKTNATLTLSPLALADSGSYDLVAANEAGAATSQVAVVTVYEPATHYVALDGGHVFPFTNWAGAATSIQAAVDAAYSGDVVRVTNGVYESDGVATPGGGMPCRVVVTNAVSVESVNGPAATAIVGLGPVGAYAVRGVFLSGGARLAGFMVRDGATWASGNPYFDVYAGGIFVDTAGFVSNCVVENCAGHAGASGLLLYRGGDAWDCTIRNCETDNEGGGVILSRLNGTGLHRSRVLSNRARWGGGVSIYLGGVVEDCLIAGNAATESGGGARVASGGATTGSVFRSCTIANNGAPATGGIAHAPDGGLVVNSIVYGNTNGDWSGGSYLYTCTAPLPAGTGNLAGDPLFADAEFRLAVVSPCVDAGSAAEVRSPRDLEGRPRILGSGVDLGAYERAVEPDDPSLVLYYAFDGETGANVLDRSGNGNHGVLVKAGWTSGVAGAGASFRGTAGSGAVIRALNSASLNSMQNTRQLTACLWVRPRSFPLDIPVLIGKGGNQAPSATNGYEFYVNATASNELSFVSGPDYFSSPATGGSLIRSRTGQWVHVACTVDSRAGTGRFYVNGVDAGPVNFYGTSVTGLLYATTHDLFVGGPIPNHNANRSWFNGDMDEIRIYNRALTPEELARVFADKAPPPPVLVQAPESQVGVVGGSVAFAAAATGPGPLYYQWTRNGADLPGASNATFAIATLGLEDAADYRVRVSNPWRAVTSGIARLSVLEGSLQQSQVVLVQTAGASRLYLVRNDFERTNGPMTVQTTISNQLPLGASLIFWDQVHQAYKPAGVYSYIGWNLAVRTQVLRRGESFFVRLPPSGAGTNRSLVFAGQAPTNPATAMTVWPGFNFLGYPYPVVAQWTNTQCAAAVPAGASSLILWNASNQSWDAAIPKSALGWGTAGAAVVIPPGIGFLLRSSSTSPVAVSESKPYTSP